MTAYVSDPFSKRTALIPGKIGFSFGSLDTHLPTARLSIRSVAITSNVATIACTLIEGYAPAIGSLISIQGTQTVTSGGGNNFNVKNVAIATVSLDYTTGVGTITFALTSNDIATTKDAGIAAVPVPIVQETLPGTAAAGLQFAIQSDSAGNKQHGLTWFTQYSGSPSTVTMNLQIADIDVDSAYTTIDESTNTAGETRSVGNVTANFVRVQAASTGGTSPKVAAGVMLS